MVFMQKDMLTVRELLQLVLQDIKLGDGEIIFFVLQKDYYIRMGEPAVANFSALERAIQDLFGSSRVRLLQKFEGSHSVEISQSA